MRALRSGFAAFAEFFAGFFCFAAVPENGFGGTSGAAIVEKEIMLVHNGNETEAPERWGAPFLARGFEVWAIVGEAFAHVMEQEIGEGMKGLV